MEAIATELTAGHDLGVSAFAVEDLVALELEVGQLGFATAPAVEFAVCRNHGAQELGNGFRGGFRRDAVLTEGHPEAFHVIGVGREPGDGFVPGEVHLIGVGHRVEDLLLERGGATVPEEVLRPAHVDQGHGVAGALRTGHARRHRVGIGKGEARQVARAAALGAVGGQPLLPEEQAPQFDPFHRHRIVRRDVHGRKEGGDVDFQRRGTDRLHAFRRGVRPTACGRHDQGGCEQGRQAERLLAEMIEHQLQNSTAAGLIVS